MHIIIAICIIKESHNEYSILRKMEFKLQNRSDLKGHLDLKQCSRYQTRWNLCWGHVFLSNVQTRASWRLRASLLTYLFLNQG